MPTRSSSARGDVVIFSSRQIPGNEVAIGRIQNALAAKNVRMITERQSHIHVSGHPGRPELQTMYGWIRPEILVPVHGELRHMAEQARFGHANGIKRTIVQKNGDVIRLAPDGPEKLAEVQAGRLVLDGDVILPADGSHHERPAQAHAARPYQRRLRDRRQGQMTGTPEIRMKGVPVEEDLEAFLEEASEALVKALRNASHKADIEGIREVARLAVRRVATDWTGKKPVVDVTVVRL